MPSKRVFFENYDRVRLSGILELTHGQPRAFAIFSHCFTCSKDLKAIVRISRGLAKHGISVLRFDFTGLGDSKGDFSATNFDNNCADVMAAVNFLSDKFEPPQILIGHSLGGAAMMYVSNQIASAKALVTIASPSSTQHLADYLSATNPEIEAKGEGHVEIGGRTWTLQRQLIENLRSTDLPAAIVKMRIPHLILHPVDDETLPYWHAEKLFELTGGPKAMVSLDGADHLLVAQPGDVGFVADLINLWTSRYLG
jgi:putative redox protein